MPRLQMKVLRKPAQTDMEIAAHAYCVGTTMHKSCLLFENFSGFHLQEFSITLQQKNLKNELTEINPMQR